MRPFFLPTGNRAYSIRAVSVASTDPGPQPLRDLVVDTPNAGLPPRPGPYTLRIHVRSRGKTQLLDSTWKNVIKITKDFLKCFDRSDRYGRSDRSLIGQYSARVVVFDLSDTIRPIGR